MLNPLDFHSIKTFVDTSGHVSTKTAACKARRLSAPLSDHQIQRVLVATCFEDAVQRSFPEWLSDVIWGGAEHEKFKNFVKVNFVDTKLMPAADESDAGKSRGLMSGFDRALSRIFLLDVECPAIVWQRIAALENLKDMPTGQCPIEIAATGQTLVLKVGSMRTLLPCEETELDDEVRTANLVRRLGTEEGCLLIKAWTRNLNRQSHHAKSSIVQFVDARIQKKSYDVAGVIDFKKNNQEAWLLLSRYIGTDSPAAPSTGSRKEKPSGRPGGAGATRPDADVRRGPAATKMISKNNCSHPCQISTSFAPKASLPELQTG